MRHCSSSETLKQTEQNFTFALTSISTSASRRTSAGSACQQVERDALRALGPDAGQPAELVDQVLDDAFVQRPSGPGEPEPPGMRRRAAETGARAALGPSASASALALASR